MSYHMNDWQIIGDAHIDSYQELITEKISILDSYFCKKNIIILGDVFDSRKSASTIAVKMLQDLFEKHNDKTFHILIGNHDCVFHNTLIPNSITTSFKNISNVKITDKPTEIDDFLLVPWFSNKTDNYEECIDSIKESNKKYLCGHLEIQSFYMSKGIKNVSGLKKSDFKQFDKVFSGHYHLRQEHENILYVGSITQNSWTDFENQKGYYVIDDKITFVEDQKQIYKHITLCDNDSTFNVDDYSDCHIKLFHKMKLTKKQFDLIEKLKNVVRSYKIFDESFEIKERKIEKVEFVDVIEEFFEQQEIEEEFKNNLKDYLKTKYKEISE